jgi:hypothetical protein
MIPELFEVNNAKYRLDFELSLLLNLMPHTQRWQETYEKQIARVRIARREYLTACVAYNNAMVSCSIAKLPV